VAQWRLVQGTLLRVMRRSRAAGHPSMGSLRLSLDEQTTAADCQLLTDMGRSGGSGVGGAVGRRMEVDRCVRLLEEDRLLSTLLGESVSTGNSKHGRGSYGATGSRKGKPSQRVLYTRLLSLFPALLDDLCPVVARRVLEKVDQWQFNAFLLDRLTGGHCLPSICVHILHKTGLMSHFKMDPCDVMTFFRLVERGYHTANPYHNALHASDVTQAMYVYCQQTAIACHLSRVELLAALVAAVSHDLDHPGVNEKFLVSTGNHLALLYDNVSVLENHHWRSAIACFVDAGLTKYLTEVQFTELTDLVRSLILATDISRQQEFLTQFRYFLDHGELNLALAHHRHFILQIGIKCADISNPCRTWSVSRLWSLRACEEFFRQGDLERELGLGVTPICDRFNVTVAKVQVGFYSFVVEPLFTEWHRFLASDLTHEMLAYFRSNQTKWEEEVLQQGAEEAVDTSQSSPAVVLQSPSETISVTPAATATTYRPPLLPLPVPSQSAGSRDLNMGTPVGRRMSLPCNDPLLRVFDQMTQPDGEMTGRGASTAATGVNLRRNFSLTERRRSSLLRGLFNRSSLRPGRGRLGRPTSVCLEGTEGSKCSRALQPRENRLSSPTGSSAASQLLDESNSAFTSTTTAVVTKLVEQSALATASAATTTATPLADVEKENSASSAQLYERLTKRRGSAPSNLVLGDNKVSNQGLATGTGQCVTGAAGLRRQQTQLGLTVRRGSLPSDLLNESLPRQLRGVRGVFVCGSVPGNGPSTNNPKAKGLLRRRSMGPELLNIYPGRASMGPELLNLYQGGRDRQIMQKYMSRPI